MRRFLPFAALLGVALVLACQDVGTGPDGLEPQFDKKGTGKCDAAAAGGHCHGDEVVVEDASYTVTHDVDFLTAAPITDGRPGGGKQGTSVSIGHAQDRKQAFLSEDLVGQLPGPTALCFPGGVGKREVGLSAFFRARKGEVEGQYYFLAFGTDGKTQVLYNLDMSGDADGDPVAPDSGETTTVTWDEDGVFFRQGDVPACVGAGPQGRHNVKIGGSIEIEGN